jgi:hypothetical protein
LAAVLAKWADVKGMAVLKDDDFCTWKNASWIKAVSQFHDDICLPARNTGFLENQFLSLKT